MANMIKAISGTSAGKPLTINPQAHNTKSHKAYCFLFEFIKNLTKQKKPSTTNILSAISGTAVRVWAKKSGIDIKSKQLNRDVLRSKNSLQIAQVKRTVMLAQTTESIRAEATAVPRTL